MPRTPFNTGWSYRRKASAFAELGGSAGSSWTAVTLPHDALITTERDPSLRMGAGTGYFGSGVFEYRNHIYVSDGQAGDLIALEFDGVYRDAMVYVNGTLAGQRAFGYSRFIVRIDPYLRFGQENEIRVECRVHEDARWYPGAGIYRDVHLIEKAPGHLAIDGVRVIFPDVDAQQAVAEVVAQVENFYPTTKTFSIRASASREDDAPVRWAHSPITLLPGERATARLRLYVQAPALWSPDRPNLYNVAVELKDQDVTLDREEILTGIRTLQVDPTRGLRLNGEMIKLRGACIHHDNGPLGAAAIGRAEERRVELLKAAGFNALRSSHNPMSSAMLAACDRVGMLVMDEAFDMWTSSKVDFDYAFEFPEWWERDIEAMVAKDVNHPSVIMYSIGNEIPETGTPYGANLGRKLAEKVRELDSTRFVTNGINGFVSTLDEIVAGMRDAGAGEAASGGVNTMMAQLGTLMRQISASPTVTERTEESFGVLDIAGMNYGDGRYELDRELFPDRIIVGTETFPTQIAENWSLVLAHPNVLGDFTWTGWDYLGETGLGGTDYVSEGEDPGSSSVARAYPWLAAWSADIDMTGHRRPVSFYREFVFGLRTEPYIAVHRPENAGKVVAYSSPWSWSDTVNSWSWAGHEGQDVYVDVYSAADEVELLLDGQVVGRARVGEVTPFQATFVVPYAAGELTARAIEGDVVIAETTLASASDSRALRVDADRTCLHANSSDLAFVSISLTDDAGRPHAESGVPVTVEVEGAGVLQGLGSADPRADTGFSGPGTLTFDGRALAIVRPTAPGAVSVTVSAPGVPAVSLMLHVDGASVDASEPLHLEARV